MRKDEEGDVQLLDSGLRFIDFGSIVLEASPFKHGCVSRKGFFRELLDSSSLSLSTFLILTRVRGSRNRGNR